MAANSFAIFDLSTADLLIILAVILLLFGAKKLPELSKSLGSSARELRKGLSGDDKDHAKAKSKDESKDSAPKE